MSPVIFWSERRESRASFEMIRLLYCWRRYPGEPLLLYLLLSFGLPSERTGIYERVQQIKEGRWRRKMCRGIESAEHGTYFLSSNTVFRVSALTFATSSKNVFQSFLLVPALQYTSFFVCFKRLLLLSTHRRESWKGKH